LLPLEVLQFEFLLKVDPHMAQIHADQGSNACIGGAVYKN
jgi:hypothetical protein